ncbi:chemocyanin-like [Gossypium hirsutum]|uniref:Chemocyanin-like n=1 Tax=Gossypium hirsutum TaxID=3635 RepID=A0A1U8I301_GOSHI|nr:chemocyanin-like [Gossypium hirsutum]
MGQEGGSAMIWLTLLLCFQSSFAATFMVGDASEFKYNRPNHDVAVVDKEGYEACYVADDAQVFETGDDLITLQQGHNYFVCGFPGHCNNGMKIAVTAT